MEKVFGIDLGTTYSCISYVDEFGKPIIIPNSENERITPSVVFFDGDNVIVGNVAKENSKIYPTDVVSFIKRSMGDSEFFFEHDEKIYRPEEITSFILRKLVGDAENNLGEAIKDVVITCPAYFGINEREATKAAGEIAGLNVREVLNEPTAAAIAYGMDNTEDKVVLVYDLGGGTFDISMIDIKKDSIKVICTGGDHNLGGKDWDDRIISYMQDQFREQTERDEDILSDMETWQELQLLAERAKKTLSQREKAPLSINFDGDRAKVTLTREKFEEITSDLLQRTITLTNDMLEEAKAKGYTNFDEILLVGGSSRMPIVKETIKEEFSIEPKLFDPDEAVAKGAAIYGNKLSLNDELVKRIAAYSGEDEKKVKENLEQNEISQNIMEKAVKELADDTGFTISAVKAANVNISNVVSKSFGVIAINGDEKEIVSNLILKNSQVPSEITKIYGTSENNQESVLIRIMENESNGDVLEKELANEIGTAELNLPDSLPYNSPIKITFKLNNEGILEMSAVEGTENRTVQSTIKTTSVIQGEELERAKEKSKNIIVS